MKFLHGEAQKLNSLMHVNAHVSYLLTCDSKAKDDINNYAEANVIAYYKNGELNIVNGFDLKKRTELAKEIRKLAKDSLKSVTDRVIQSKLRMELSYLQDLEDYHFEEESGFGEMVEFIADYIKKKEEEAIMCYETSFLYVLHLHQNQCPHLHRFYKIL